MICGLEAKSYQTNNMKKGNMEGLSISRLR